MNGKTSLLAQLYDAAAMDYERTRVPRFRPFVKKLLQLYDTRPRLQVLDAATGTGLVATLVAPRVGHEGRVVGVDASEAMLTIARQRAKNFGFTQCEFRQGDIQALDFPDGTFDLVICSFAVAGTPHDLFAEFRRVLKPNSGVLLFQDWVSTDAAPEMAYAEAFAAYRSVEPSASLRAVRGLIETLRKDWHPLAAPEDYTRVLCEAGFRQAPVQVETMPVHFSNAEAYVEWQGGQVIQRAELAELDSARRAEFSRAAVESVRPFETDKGLDVEWSAFQVVARV